MDVNVIASELSENQHTGTSLSRSPPRWSPSTMSPSLTTSPSPSKFPGVATEIIGDKMSVWDTSTGRVERSLRQCGIARVRCLSLAWNGEE